MLKFFPKLKIQLRIIRILLTQLQYIITDSGVSGVGEQVVGPPRAAECKVGQLVSEMNI